VSSEDSKTGYVCGELNPADNKYYTVKEETNGGITETTTYTQDPETYECTSETVCSGSGETYSTYQVSCLRWDNGEIEQRPDWTRTDTYTANADCSTTVEEGEDYSYDTAVYEECYFIGPSVVNNPPFRGVHDPIPPPVYSVPPPEEILVPPLTLPAYPDFDAEPSGWLTGQGSSCTAHHTDELTTDAHGNVTSRTISQRKVKWRSWNYVTGTCYYKHWVMQRTETEADPDAVPPVEASVSTTEAGTWEWIGTGDPCIPMPTSPRESDGNRMDEEAEDAHEIAVPEVGQTVEVGSAIYYSCVPGYTPVSGDPTKPNRYPCPNCEAEAP
jgi:hypothetical protein